MVPCLFCANCCEPAGTLKWYQKLSHSYHAIHNTPMDSIFYSIQQRREGFRRTLTQIMKAASVRYYQTCWSRYNKSPRNSLDTQFPEAEDLFCIYIYLLLHIFTYMRASMRNLFYFFRTLYMTYTLLSQPPLVTAEVRCAKWAFYLNAAQSSDVTWKMVCWASISWEP